MKNFLQPEFRSSESLSLAFSLCRKSFLLVVAFLAPAAQAAENQLLETVFMAQSNVLSVPNFGNQATVQTPLTTTTVITGSVSGYSGGYDRVDFTLPSGYEINSTEIVVSNYTPADGSVHKGLQINTGSYANQIESRLDGNNRYELPIAVRGKSAVIMSAPGGRQTYTDGVATFIRRTIGSASYRITLNITKTTPVSVAELAGNYIGLVRSDRKLPSRMAQIVNPSSNVSPTAIPNEALDARLEMAVTTTGSVSGKMAFGPTVIPFIGAFPVIAGKTLPEIVIPIPEHNRSLSLKVGVNTDGQSYMSGDLTQRGLMIYSGEGVVGWKNTWSANNAPGPEIISYKTFSTHKVGWTTNFPLGSSFGSVKAGATVGTYLTAGTLADGQKFTSTGFYGPLGDVLIYQSLYDKRGRGSFSGTAVLNTGLQAGRIQEVTIPNIVPFLKGEFRWLKQPSPPATNLVSSGPPKKYGKHVPAGAAVSSDTLYPAGFDSYYSLNGAAYSQPGGGQLLNVHGSQIAGVNEIRTDVWFGGSPHTLTSFGAQLLITSPGAFSTINRISAASPGPYAESLNTFNQLRFQTFDTATGYFKGSIRATPPRRTISFEGMFVYDNEIGSYVGFGFCIANQFTRTDTGVVMRPQRGSGQVMIRKIRNE